MNDIKIHPQQLRQLREGKGCTRVQLAEDARVSERQIARIESSSGPVKVREHTYSRLREALGDAISKPSQHRMEDAMPFVDGDALRFQRDRRGFSRRQLAEKSGISVRTIERLEGSDERASPRPMTVNRLAKALQVKPIEFAHSPEGEAPDPTSFAQKHEVWLEVSQQVGIAYDLVCQRYGVQRFEIIKLAPVLFTLLAERSLQWRKRMLEEMSDALEKAENLQDENPHLWFGFKEDRHYWGLEAEEESIERLDILGRHAAQHVGEEYNFKLEDGITPFLNYLRMLADEIDHPGVIDLSEVSDPKGLDWFGSSNLDKKECKVCAREFERLTGGSEEAEFALRVGKVALSEIPKELLSDESKSERVAWLEGALDSEARRACHWLKSKSSA